MNDVNPSDITIQGGKSLRIALFTVDPHVLIELQAFPISLTSSVSPVPYLEKEVLRL